VKWTPGRPQEEPRPSQHPTPEDHSQTR
jgi:hypothetical protein